MKTKNIIKWALLCFLLLFISVCFTVFIKALSPFNKYTNLSYKEYQSINLFGREHIFPESSDDISVYHFHRRHSYIYSEARIENAQPDLEFILAKCHEFAPKDGTKGLYRKEDIPFNMKSFTKVFLSSSPKWWTEDTMKIYTRNKLVASDNSGFWIFYNIEKKFVRVFQWHGEDHVKIDYLKKELEIVQP